MNNSDDDRAAFKVKFSKGGEANRNEMYGYEKPYDIDAGSGEANDNVAFREVPKLAENKDSSVSRRTLYWTAFGVMVAFAALCFGVFTYYF